MRKASWLCHPATIPLFLFKVLNRNEAWTKCTILGFTRTYPIKAMIYLIFKATCWNINGQDMFLSHLRFSCQNLNFKTNRQLCKAYFTLNNCYLYIMNMCDFESLNSSDAFWYFLECPRIENWFMLKQNYYLPERSHRRLKPYIYWSIFTIVFHRRIQSTYDN